MFVYLLLFVLATSDAVSSTSDEQRVKEANAKAKAEIVGGMSKATQDNTDLRKMLAGKFVAENNLDDAMNQYRHIVRIQTEKFGEGSAEVAVAVKEADEHHEVLKRNERATYEAFLQDPESLVAGLNEDQKKTLMKNSRVKERMAREMAEGGDRLEAGRLYGEIAEQYSDRYGPNSKEHQAVLKRQTDHEEL
jgi:hypothetical protein